MADNKRGGRSDDDEFDENAVADEAFDDDEVIDAEIMDEESDDSKAVAKTSRSVSRSATRGKRDEQRLGLVGRLVKFIREVVAELQKVIYPTRKELLTYTAVVLVFVVVVMTVVSLLDLGFASLIGLVFGNQTTT